MGTTEAGRAGAWERQAPGCGGQGIVLKVSKSVCALHRSCLHRRQKRGQGVPLGGSLVGKGPEAGRGGPGRSGVKEGEGLCPSVHYI